MGETPNPPLKADPEASMRRPSTPLLLAVLLLPALGCGQKKINECNAVVQVINAGVVSLEKAPKNEGDPTGVSDLKSMADAMDKVAADAAAVQLTLPKLIRLRDDYHKMAKDIAKAERELAAAAQERDAARRKDAEATLDAAVKQ